MNDRHEFCSGEAQGFDGFSAALLHSANDNVDSREWCIGLSDHVHFPFTTIGAFAGPTIARGMYDVALNVPGFDRGVIGFDRGVIGSNRGAFGLDRGDSSQMLRLRIRADDGNAGLDRTLTNGREKVNLGDPLNGESLENRF